MGYVDRVIVSVPEQGVWCSECEDTTWWISKMTDDAIALLGKPAKCRSRCTGTYVAYDRPFQYEEVHYVCECGSRNADKHYQWGIYRGIFCDPCARKQGIYDGREFDPGYAGESLDEDEGVGYYGSREECLEDW